MATVGELINAITIMEKALRELELDNPDIQLRLRNKFGTACEITIHEWVEYVLDEVRSSKKTAKGE